MTRTLTAAYVSVGRVPFNDRNKIDYSFIPSTYDSECGHTSYIFPSRAAAMAAIEADDKAPHYQSYGEIGRPSYRVRTVAPLRGRMREVFDLA